MNLMLSSNQQNSPEVSSFSQGNYQLGFYADFEVLGFDLIIYLNNKVQPPLPFVISFRLKEKHSVHCSDEEVDDPPQVDNNEDLSDDGQKEILEEDLCYEFGADCVRDGVVLRLLLEYYCYGDRLSLEKCWNGSVYKPF
ncbi:hypothetical protein Vadar_010776 [Vaccinium darrowii]|uniref:Uncharacterized protein n=1 Tax=Vaccinium darrowii TaxID=229202 RepID=A0ACB7ZBB6_9ERIC|nr:hypothetical protein Vadar_010776 [Vaccinium darrowii]